MRTTINLDDELLDSASAAIGIAERSVVVHEGLRSLIQREAARRLALLGGSDPVAAVSPRRRPGRVAAAPAKPVAKAPRRAATR